MDIYLVCDKEVVQLPILPPAFEIGLETGHTTIRTNNFGELTLLGKRNSQTLEISSFFPGQNYPFARYKKDRAAYWYPKKINSWNSKIIRVLITSTNFNKLCTITSWNYGEPDGSGDIAYTLSLREYRKPTYEKVEKVVSTVYTVKKGDTLKSISKKLVGKSNYDQEIYRQNKTVIEKAAKKNKKKSSKKKGVPGGWLFAGTKLKIYIVIKKWT